MTTKFLCHRVALFALLAILSSFPLSRAAAAESNEPQDLKPGMLESMLVHKSWRSIPSRNPEVDPAVYARWGFLANLAGKSFKVNSKPAYFLTAVWRKPGEVLEFKTHREDGSPYTILSMIIRFDATRQRLVEEERDWPGYRQADQSYYFGKPGFLAMGTQFIPTNEGFYITEQGAFWHFQQSGPAALADSATPTANGRQTPDPFGLAMPVATTTPAVPTSWGWLDAFLGKALMYQSENMEWSAEAGGTTLKLAEFKFRRTPDAHQLKVLNAPQSCPDASASIASDGGITIECEQWDYRQRWAYAPNGDSITVAYSQLSRDGLNFIKRWEHVRDYRFEPVTEERRSAERTRRAAEEESNRYYAERRRIQNAEEAEERRESQQRLAEQFGQMLGDLTAHANKEMQNSANQAAFLENINANARAAQARANAQAQREQADRNQQIAQAQRFVAQQVAQRYEPQDPAPQLAQPRPTYTAPVREREPAQASGRVAGPTYQPFPEAVMVCTVPSGPNGNFSCATPLNRRSGHLKDVSGSRTPDEMVNGSDACPNPRRLQSSRELVWGCGFAATGNSNSLDRGQGINIIGRSTYYCTPKETSCRRNSP